MARFTTPPTPERKVLINTLVGSLIDAGVWAKLDGLWLLAAADAQAGRRNWIQNAYNLTAVNSPAFAADRGYTGNGSSSYLDTGLVPSTFGGLYALNDASFGYWSLTSRAGNSSNPMGSSSGVNSSPFSIINPRFTDDRLYPTVNDTGSGGGGAANTQTSGLLSAQRDSAANVQVYRDGSLLANLSIASVALPSNSFALLARKTGSGAVNVTADQICMGYVGRALGALHSDLKNAVETYLTAVGAV
ncbi:hypothetical protein [Devosia enhydra]|uniref:hypothetical protein n=1 Tax=Devosia enhydra TaxID=665118 RepID=UPI0011603404|nr:hypothetical protein [Devosia enhydra]